MLDRGFVLAASEDANVYFYNLDGGLVGVFGVHRWNLSDESTFQDIRGLQTLPPMDHKAALYEAARLAKEPGARLHCTSLLLQRHSKCSLRHPPVLDSQSPRAPPATCNPLHSPLSRPNT